MASMENSRFSDKLRGPYNRGGAMLAWIALTMVVLLIIIGAILTMAMAYYQGGVGNVSQSQALFSARSSVAAFSQALRDNPEGVLATKIVNMPITKEGAEPLDLGSVEFTANEDMGFCRLRVFKADEKTVYVEAQAVVGEKEATVVGKMAFQAIANTINPTLPPYTYIGGSKEIQILRSTSLGGLYFDEAEAKIVISASGGVDIIAGSIYAKRPLEVSGSPNQNSATTVKGNIFSTKTLKFSRYITIEGDVETSGNVTIHGDNHDVLTMTNGTLKAPGVSLTGSSALRVKEIDTTTVSMAKDTSLTGDVFATKVSLETGAKITGRVVADELSVIKLNGPCVNGTLKVNTLTINGVVYSHRNLTTFQEDYPDVKAIATGGITFSTVAAVPSEGVAETIIPDPLLPALSAPSSLPRGVVTEVSGNLVLDAKDGNDHFYVLADDVKAVNTITLQGTGKIVLYVPEDKVLHIQRLIYDSSYDRKAPSFFIKALKNSSVTLEPRTELYGYLYGEAGSNITIGSRVAIVGGLFVQAVSDGKKTNPASLWGSDVTVKTIPLAPKADEKGEGNSDTVRKQWYVQQYLDALPEFLEGGV